MSTARLSVDELAALARQLSPMERARLIEQVAASLREETPSPESGKRSMRSLRGLLADFGPAPSADEIDQMRRDMLSGFPREDIA